MKCHSCGSQLPPEAKVCPNCGTFTPASYSNSGSSSFDPTVVVHPSRTPTEPPASYEPTIAASPADIPPPPPPTAYASYPYAPPFVPSGQSNPSTPIPNLSG